MNWALLGCVLYALGAVCELVEWPVLSDNPVRVGYHEVFHLFNAAASVALFLFVARYIVPFKPTPAAKENESLNTTTLLNSSTGLANCQEGQSTVIPMNRDDAPEISPFPRLGSSNRLARPTQGDWTLRAAVSPTDAR